MPPSDRPVLLNDPDHYVHPRLHTFQPLVGGADRVTSAVLYNVATQEGRSLDPVAALKLLETSRSKHIPFVMSLSCHEKHDFFKLPPEVDYYSFPLSSKTGSSSISESPPAMQSISDSRVDFITVMGPSSFLSNKSKVSETSAWCRPIYGSITVAIMPTAQEGETIQLTLQTNQLLIVPAGWKVATKTKEGSICIGGRFMRPFDFVLYFSRLEFTVKQQPPQGQQELVLSAKADVAEAVEALAHFAGKWLLPGSESPFLGKSPDAIQQLAEDFNFISQALRLVVNFTKAWQKYFEPGFHSRVEGLLQEVQDSVVPAGLNSGSTESFTSLPSTCSGFVVGLKETGGLTLPHLSRASKAPTENTAGGSTASFRVEQPSKRQRIETPQAMHMYPGIGSQQLLSTVPSMMTQSMPSASMLLPFTSNGAERLLTLPPGLGTPFASNITPSSEIDSYASPAPNIPELDPPTGPPLGYTGESYGVSLAGVQMSPPGGVMDVTAGLTATAPLYAMPHGTGALGTVMTAPHPSAFSSTHLHGLVPHGARLFPGMVPLQMPAGLPPGSQPWQPSPLALQYGGMVLPSHGAGGLGMAGLRGGAASTGTASSSLLPQSHSMTPRIPQFESIEQMSTMRPDAAPPQPASVPHRVSCHRCGNVRKHRHLCQNCPHTFCRRCFDKILLTDGPTAFTGGCPVCKELCCCAQKSERCTRHFHCYGKCPVAKQRVKKVKAKESSEED